MKMKQIVLAGTMALACVFSSITYAAEITLATPGIIGTASGLSGDKPGSDAAWLAQAILDLDQNDDLVFGGRRWQASTVADYNGTIDALSADKTEIPKEGEDPGRAFTAPPGYLYALGKYDGQNAGWILFHLPTIGSTLPEFSYSIWGQDAEQYRLSNYTVFNSVPDGGATVALLGSILVGFGILRRRLIKS
jgi:hypothetical protein